MRLNRSYCLWKNALDDLHRSLCWGVRDRAQSQWTSDRQKKKGQITKMLELLFLKNSWNLMLSDVIPEIVRFNCNEKTEFAFTSQIYGLVSRPDYLF